MIQLANFEPKFLSFSCAADLALFDLAARVQSMLPFILHKVKIKLEWYQFKENILVIFFWPSV